MTKAQGRKRFVCVSEFRLSNPAFRNCLSPSVECRIRLLVNVEQMIGSCFLSTVCLLVVTCLSKALALLLFLCRSFTFAIFHVDSSLFPCEFFSRTRDVTVESWVEISHSTVSTQSSYSVGRHQVKVNVVSLKIFLSVRSLYVEVIHFFRQWAMPLSVGCRQ